METRILARINIVARAVLAFVFIYHGLVPKLLWLSSFEAALTKAHHLDISASMIAGVLEVSLGISLLALRRTLIPVYLSGVIMIALLIDVMIVMPRLLIETFNPVTINIATIFMAYFAIITQDYAKAYNTSLNGTPLRGAL